MTPVFELDGHTATLRLYDDRIEIAERSAVDGSGARLLIPLRSCGFAEIDEQWARDGSVALRLELNVELGYGDSVAIFLQFPVPCRIQLERLINLVRHGDRPSLLPPAAAPTAPPAPQALPRLAVIQAPDTEEWLSFRPLPSSAEVLESAE